MKKYIMFVMLTILFTITLPCVVDALDYNGDGRYEYVKGTTTCELYWWDACPTSIVKHSTVKATIAYVENGAILSTYSTKCYTKYLNPDNDTRISSSNRTYAKDLIIENLQNCISADFSPSIDLSNLGSNTYSMYEFDSQTIENYFKDNNDANFYILLGDDSVKNEEDLKTWMKQKCEALGKDANCHEGEGKTRGFRVLIEPIYSVVKPKDTEAKKTDKTDYQKEITFITMKELLQYRSWSNSTRGLRYPFHLYTVVDDVGIIAPSTTEMNEYYKSTYDNPSGRAALDAYNSTFKNKVKSYGYGYSLNIISWPIDNMEDCFYNDYGIGVCPLSNPSCDKSKCPNKTCECEYDEENKPKCPDDCKSCDLSKCPVITDTTCNYIINKDIPTSCDTKTSGYVKDVASWSCVFESRSTKNTTEVRNHYIESSSNEYCNVYCKEEIKFDFPTYGVTVDQGKYMVINNYSYSANISPIKYTGTKTCRVTSAKEGVLNKEKFDADMISANNKVKADWINYQQKIADYNAYQNSSASYTVKDYATCRVSWRQDTYERNACDTRVAREKANNQLSIANIQKAITSTEKSLASAKANLEKAQSALTAAYAMPTKTKKQRAARNAAISSAQSNISAAGSSVSNIQTTLSSLQAQLRNLQYKTFDDCSSSSVVPYNTCDNYPDKTWWSGAYGYNNPSFSGYQGGGWEYEMNYTRYGSYRTDFSSYESQAYNTMINARATYYASKAIRDNLITTFENCTTVIPKNISYTFKPELEFEYEENIYGGNPIMLDAGSGITTYPSPSIDYYNGGNASDGTGNQTGYWNETAATTSCSTGHYCENDVESYYYSTWWESVKTVTYQYKLPSNLYRYVEKGSGQSVNTQLSGFEYYKIPVGNLPIHFSTLPGIYEYSIKTNEYNSKFDDYIFNGKKFDKRNYYTASQNLYGCQYKVNCTNIIQNTNCVAYNAACPSAENNITCRGLNVVYRTISLNSKKEAFPGESGSGRTPGSNWSNTSINNYILNNRGVSDYEVYHLSPLYELELTPAIMRLFRSYNKKMNGITIIMYRGTLAEKSGIAGYSDFSSMDCTNGTKCKSSLLRGKITGYNNINVTGCGISGTGYTNCGSGNQAW